uniref:Uncharacterized protein n=1 Tax=Plectus sambesii TaxID=2011161 RepID=A0A914VB01_9BILA
MVFCSIRVRIIWAIIGISAGIMAGAVFGVQYHNYSATTLAFISSIFATLLMLLHIWYSKGKLSYWSKAKFSFVTISCLLVWIAALVGMVVCLVVAGVKGQNLTHEGLQHENFWITAVWCWMTFKWSMMIWWYSRIYSRDVMNPLTKSPPTPPTLD